MRALVRRSRSFVSIACLLAAASVSTAAAQAPVPPAPPAKLETAPVVVDGNVLFRLRGVPSFPAAQRAAEVAARIVAVARDESFAVSALRVSEEAERASIFAGDRRIVSVLDADAAVEDLEQEQGPAILAQLYKGKIATAIERFRHERTPAYLQRQALHAVIGVVLAIAVLLSVRWVLRRTAAAAERRFQRHLEQLEAQSYQLLPAEQVRSAWQGGLRALRSLTIFVVIVVGLDYVLSLFPWTRGVARRGTALIVDPLVTMWASLIDSLPGLVFIALVVVITRYVLRVTWLFFGGIAAGRIGFSGFEQHWAWPTYRLVRLAVIAFAIILAYPYIPGSSSEAFKGVSIFLGLLMSLGAASMVANALAGYTLIYRRAFKVGDRIQVGEVIGDVVAMRQQVTHLRTPKNEEVTVPSSTILSEHVVNYSSLAREHGLILHTTVGIGYETPWRQVEAMLIEAATRTEGLLREPPPFVLQKSLGDFCVTYEINVYCDQPQRMATFYTALHQNILDVFNEFGVQIMTPAYEGDPEQPKVVTKKDWFAAPAKAPPGTVVDGAQDGARPR